MLARIITIAIVLLIATPAVAETIYWNEPVPQRTQERPLAEPSWHHDLSRGDWEKIKAREAQRKQVAAACIRERYRLSDAHSRAVSYLGTKDRTLGGGYVGSGMIIRDEREIKRIVYRGIEQINRIMYSLDTYPDPAQECSVVADTYIIQIRNNISVYP